MQEKVVARKLARARTQEETTRTSITTVYEKRI